MNHGATSSTVKFVQGRCPYCRTLMKRATAVNGETREPRSGDLSLCNLCGGFILFRCITQLDDGASSLVLTELSESAVQQASDTVYAQMKQEQEKIRHATTDMLVSHVLKQLLRERGLKVDDAER